MENWLGTQGFPVTSENVLIFSIGILTEEDVSFFSPNITVPDYILASARLYLNKASDATLVDNITAADNHAFMAHIDNETTVLFGGRLSHWYVSPDYPNDLKTNKTFSPFFISLKETAFKDDAEILSKFHVCPHVILPEHNLSITATKTGYFIVDYQTNVTFNEIYIHNGSIYLCLETFEGFFESSHAENIPDDPNSSVRAISILTFVCVIISIVFAFMTFMIYLLIKELRTQPGVNNMFLSALVVISQSLFLFGFNQATTVSSSSCTALGVLIHYFWLLLLVWMNVCTLHMFRVFRAKHAKSIGFNTLKTTIHYVIYCAVAASLPVIITMVIASARSGGEDIGYGGQYCYITRSDFHVYILSIPLGLIIVSNIALYVAVIVRIERTRSQIRTGSEHRGLGSAYAKLSTLTGATWVFAFVFLFADQEWAEYIFVILNGSQGLFIFVAFIVNKRVLEFLKAKTGKRPEKQSKVKASSHNTSTEIVPTSISESQTLA